MDVANLRADCARCAALCCVALAFDRSPLFGLDKAAGEPCPNLESCGRCRIHASRERLGFSGCVRYDCLGAGQRVTAEVFGGRSWMQDRALLPRMLRAFETMRLVHELIQLLGEAGKLDLPMRERNVLATLERALQPPGGWTEELLASPAVRATARRVRGFLRSLEAHVGGRRPRPDDCAARSGGR